MEISSVMPMIYFEAIGKNELLKSKDKIKQFSKLK
jgi:hypothetical protein